MNLKDLDCASDDVHISEVEARGYAVSLYDDGDMRESLEKLYLDYMLTGKDFFETQLKKFFNDYLQKTLR